MACSLLARWDLACWPTKRCPDEALVLVACLSKTLFGKGHMGKRNKTTRNGRIVSLSNAALDVLDVRAPRQCRIATPLISTQKFSFFIAFAKTKCKCLSVATAVGCSGLALSLAAPDKVCIVIVDVASIHLARCVR